MCGIDNNDATLYLVKGDGWFCKDCLESVYGSLDEVETTSSDDIDFDEYEYEQDVFDSEYDNEYDRDYDGGGRYSDGDDFGYGSGAIEEDY